MPRRLTFHLFNFKLQLLWGFQTSYLAHDELIDNRLGYSVFSDFGSIDVDESHT